MPQPTSYYPAPCKVGTFGCTISYKLCIFLKTLSGAESFPGGFVLASRVLYCRATLRAPPPMNYLCKNYVCFLCPVLLCLLLHFEEKRLLWAVLRVIWVSGSGSQLSSNEHPWVGIRVSRCVGLAVCVITRIPVDDCQSVYFTCHECSSGLQSCRLF